MAFVSHINAYYDFFVITIRNAYYDFFLKIGLDDALWAISRLAPTEGRSGAFAAPCKGRFAALVIVGYYHCIPFCMNNMPTKFLFG